MRAFSALLLLSLGGCDTLWAGYIGLGDFALDGGNTTECAISGTCDLGTGDGSAPPDLYLPGCSSDATCSAVSSSFPFCDLNTGQCTATQPLTGAFPSDPAFESTLPINNHFLLLGTGDYDGDGITDIAVSGSFVGLPNATSAMDANVEIYLGNGAGGFTADAPCIIPATNPPVHLLTVPAPGKQYKGVLVATLRGNVYYCERVAGAGGTWTATLAGNAKGTGFRQLALANNEGQNSPDLVIRTTRVRYLEAADTSGSLDVYRTKPPYTFTGAASQASSTNIAWASSVRPKGAIGDYLALTWDDPNPSGLMVGRYGIEFYYTSAQYATDAKGYSAPVNMSGQYFTTFAKPLRTTTVLHAKGQDPSILFTVSQKPNYLGVLYGNAAPAFTLQTLVTTWAPTGVMLPYTGDANGDGQDEIGLYSSYSSAIGGTATEQYLQLLSYKNGVIDTANPITSLHSSTDNYQGMALEYLGGPADRRRVLQRKDLIALIDDGTSSRVLIRRANLNYTFP